MILIFMLNFLLNFHPLGRMDSFFLFVRSTFCFMCFWYFFIHFLAYFFRVFCYILLLVCSKSCRQFLWSFIKYSVSFIFYVEGSKKYKKMKSREKCIYIAGIGTGKAFYTSKNHFATISNYILIVEQEVCETNFSTFFLLWLREGGLIFMVV